MFQVGGRSSDNSVPFVGPLGTRPVSSSNHRHHVNTTHTTSQLCSGGALKNSMNLVCSLVRYKIGGFKLEDDEVDPFKSAQRIDAYFELINDEYILKKLITKNRFSEILIDVSRY